MRAKVGDFPGAPNYAGATLRRKPAQKQLNHLRLLSIFRGIAGLTNKLVPRYRINGINYSPKE